MKYNHINNQQHSFWFEKHKPRCNYTPANLHIFSTLGNLHIFSVFYNWTIELFNRRHQPNKIFTLHLISNHKPKKNRMLTSYARRMLLNTSSACASLLTSGWYCHMEKKICYFLISKNKGIIKLISMKHDDHKRYKIKNQSVQI